MNYTPDDLIKADHEASTAAAEAAPILAELEVYKETAKDLLEAIKARLSREAVDKKLSGTALEMLARDTQDWKEFRDEQFKAIREAARAKVQATNAERHWHSIQSCLSYRKEEMKRLDG